ncbi:SDR family oxidoreductase [Streptomyces sp. NPDC047028]|uniref:SDR family oxidoreductase n=1 Tax=Streptomyces sp. NPDC047028 TaxID=3155793 RepID=UPI003407A6F4
MNIVMTGATGFVGSHLLARLLADGHTVRALGRDTPQKALVRLASALQATGAPAPVVAALPAQVRPVTVRIEAPGLGLEPSEFRRLADEADVIWHSAAVTGLEAPSDLVHRVNAMGTRNILMLASAGTGLTRVCHISTAFVAGGRRSGLVGEDDLDAANGFLCPYEESKYTAERLVRAWARRRAGRRVTVFRPSVLVTNRPVPRSAPQHPNALLGARLSLLAQRGPGPMRRRLGLNSDAGEGATVGIRMEGRQDAILNILPVEYAVDAMVHLAELEQDTPVRTHHIVHPIDTPVRTLVDLTTRLVPWLRVELVERITAPNPGEVFLRTMSGGYHLYFGLMRRYARATLDAADAARGAAPPPRLDDEYLDATLHGALASRPPTGDRHPNPARLPLSHSQLRNAE